MLTTLSAPRLITVVSRDIIFFYQGTYWVLVRSKSLNRNDLFLTLLLVREKSGKLLTVVLSTCTINSDWKSFLIPSQPSGDNKT